jgi:hypothetical protein
MLPGLVLADHGRWLCTRGRMFSGFTASSGVLVVAQLVVDAPDVVGLAVHQEVEPGFDGGSNQASRSTGRRVFCTMSTMT